MNVIHLPFSGTVRLATSLASGLLLAALLGCGPNSLPDQPLTLDELNIRVDGASREIGYTNKQAGSFYTETNAEHRTGWQGWHVMAKKILDDYRITIDSKPLERSAVRTTDVWPHQFTRSYRDGIKETVTFLDSLNALVVTITAPEGSSVALAPRLSQSLSPSDYVVEANGSTLACALKNDLLPTAATLAPPWIGATSLAATSDTASSRVGRTFVPGRVVIPNASDRVVFVIAAAQTNTDLKSLLSFVSTHADSLITQRRERMQRLLDLSFFRSTNSRFERSMAWAVLSMDALLMNQVRQGIFAGLPWFNNYWGRDSFISLPGATLVTGRFSEAKEILRSFADWQERDVRNPNAGRIPNLVTTKSIGYNTADGTPWFVNALTDYISSSGDTAFGREMYPVVKRSIEGTLTHHTDEFGFLVHGDAETWMDAVGPDGPWSPRGNRACDIQALWVRQLLAGSSLARSVGDDTQAEQWDSLVDTVLANFQKYFVDRTSQLLYDHLNADGTPDRQLRPNQLFATDIVQNFDVRASVFKTLTEQLVYQHGVGSLSPTDSQFHPFHHYEPTYVQDAAYHQGIVWTWLYGPWVDAATQFGKSDLAYSVTENMIRQILERGAVGTLSELLDAAPRPGELEPRLSGTFSQAWSLAEFLRTTYRSYCGIHVDATERRVSISPQLPSAISHVRCTIPIGDEQIGLEIKAEPSSGVISLDTRACRTPVRFVVALPFDGQVVRQCLFELQPGHEISLTLTAETYEMLGTGGDPVPVETSVRECSRIPQLESISLAIPRFSDTLRSLRPSAHRMLRRSEIKSVDPGAQMIADVADPQRDDVGTGAFTYPTTSSISAGCLDITRMSVSFNEENVFFRLRYRNLVDPGWHPEYGFQLTFAAIAIDTDRRDGSGRREIGRNSQYVLPPQRAAEFVIFVGGGLRVEDSRGTILAEYRPVAGDEVDPLGNVSERTVSFSLPRSLFSGEPRSWSFTALVGAQDDHGGAGIGDFRTVDRTSSEWTGGGKQRASEPNVYDILKDPGNDR